MTAEIEFSQHSLQDFEDCQLRFKLRYLDRMAWPAAPTDDPQQYERRQQQGVTFHRLVQQWLTGIPPETLTAIDPQVQIWWDSFLTASTRFPVSIAPGDTRALRLAEFSLHHRLAGSRLMAKFDLLLIRPGVSLTIYDWKTNLKPVSRAHFVNRIQTRVYLYLAVTASAAWNGGRPFAPEQVEMIYWQSAAPEEPVRLAYNTSQMLSDQEYMEATIQQMMKMQPAAFQKTEQTERCRFCNYRSYCARGTRPGNQAEWESSPEQEIDFSDVESVEY